MNPCSIRFFFRAQPASISRPLVFLGKVRSIERTKIDRLSFVRSDVPRLLSSSSSKPYLSSFKTLVNSTTRRRSQRLHYANDSVIIFKLSKERMSIPLSRRVSLSTSVHIATSVDLDEPSKLSSKHSASPMESTGSSKSIQSNSYPLRLNPILKVQGKSRLHFVSDAFSCGVLKIQLDSFSIFALSSRCLDSMRRDSSDCRCESMKDRKSTPVGNGRNEGEKKERT